jgi:hypothetical protein
MAERNAAVPPEKRIEFRIGINLGDVIAEDEDIFGDGVNVAARLEAPAEPPQAPARHHGPVPNGPVSNQPVEYGASQQFAIISGFQLSANLKKTISRQRRCRAKSP